MRTCRCPITRAPIAARCFCWHLHSSSFPCCTCYNESPNSPNTMLLDADFERCFNAGPTIQVALKRPVESFSVTALVGPSGCGKTTVLRCLAGLDVPRSGRISFGGTVWFDGPGKICERPQKRGIGYLSQEYALFPHLSVSDNIAFGLARMEKAA